MEHTENKEYPYFYRKLQAMAKGVSIGLTLPKCYANDLDLKQNEFVKITKDDNNRIIIEKVA